MKKQMIQVFTAETGDYVGGKLSEFLKLRLDDGWIVHSVTPVYRNRPGVQEYLKSAVVIFEKLEKQEV